MKVFGVILHNKPKLSSFCFKYEEIINLCHGFKAKCFFHWLPSWQGSGTGICWSKWIFIRLYNVMVGF